MIQAQQAVSQFVTQMFTAPIQAVQKFWVSEKFGLSTYPLIISLFKSEEELALLKGLMSEMAAQGLATATSSAIQAWLFKTQYRQQGDGSWLVAPAALAYSTVKGRFDDLCARGSKPGKVEKSLRTEAGFLWKDTCTELEFFERQLLGIGNADATKMPASTVTELQKKYLEMQTNVEVWKVRKEQVKLICLFLGYTPK